MEDNIYTIKRFCDELNQPRQKIRRRIEKFDIKAKNEDNRVYKNDPLEYDYQAFLILAKEFDIQTSDTEGTVSVQHCTTESTTNGQHSTTEHFSKDKLIKVLEEQLEEANKSRVNLERLLDQQQQLTLVSNKEMEALRLEIEESRELKQKKNNESNKAKWYNIFNKNKND